MTKPLSLLTRLLRLQTLFSDRRKWTKGEYVTRKANHTCYCFVGGMNKIAGKNPRKDFLVVAADEAIALGFMTLSEQGLVDVHRQIVTWNDNPERTIKDIRHRIAFGIKNARLMSKNPDYKPPPYQPETTK